MPRTFSFDACICEKKNNTAFTVYRREAPTETESSVGGIRCCWVLANTFSRFSRSDLSSYLPQRTRSRQKETRARRNDVATMMRKWENWSRKTFFHLTGCVWVGSHASNAIGRSLACGFAESVLCWLLIVVVPFDSADEARLPLIAGKVTEQIAIGWHLYNSAALSDVLIVTFESVPPSLLIIRKLPPHQTQDVALGSSRASSRFDSQPRSCAVEQPFR